MNSKYTLSLVAQRCDAPLDARRAYHDLEAIDDGELDDLGTVHFASCILGCASRRCTALSSHSTVISVVVGRVPLQGHRAPYARPWRKVNLSNAHGLSFRMKQLCMSIEFGVYRALLFTYSLTIRAVRAGPNQIGSAGTSVDRTLTSPSFLDHQCTTCWSQARLDDAHAGSDLPRTSERMSQMGERECV